MFRGTCSSVWGARRNSCWKDASLLHLPKCHVWVRVACTTRHRMYEPTGQSESPGVCLRDVQNQGGEVAPLLQLLEAFSYVRDLLQAFMVQSTVNTEIKISTSVGHTARPVGRQRRNEFPGGFKWNKSSSSLTSTPLC